APVPPEPPPLPIVAALDGYFDGLQSIAEAKDADAVADASAKAAQAIAGVAKAAGASAQFQAAPGFVAKLAKMAVARAQYVALRRAVLATDPLLPKAAPAIVAALRVRQSYYAVQVAEDGEIGMKVANATLRDTRVSRDPALELGLFQSMAPILDELAAEQTAAKADPAAAVRAMVEAHHALAVAVKDRERQAQTLLDNAVEIAGGAHDLIGGSPSPSAKGSHGRSDH
ncbi:MAG: hypothetical protein JOZ27_04025, partial [Caulobacteraceae bacterium]|nr:hypothetical protein [Caulobacteraceae bacterium]